MVKIDIKFIILLIASFIFAYAQGGNLPYTIFYLLIITFIFSFISIIMHKFLIKVQIDAGEKIYNSGDDVNISMNISNRSILPAAYVIIKGELVSIYNSKFKGEVISLNADDYEVLDYNINFKKRGIYNFGKTQLIIRDLFSIFRITKNINDKFLIKVYPKIYPLETFSLRGRDLFKSSLNNSSSIEDMYSIKDMRRYRDGDNLKRINWKVSAKCNELFVKNFDTVSGQEFNIFLDMNVENYGMDSEGMLEEDMIDFCSSVVNNMVNKNIRTKLFINCQKFGEFIIEDKEDFQNLLEYFVEQKSDGGFEFSKFINFNICKVPSTSTICIITGKIKKSLSDLVSTMADKGYSVMVFYIDINSETLINRDYLNRISVECFNICDMIKCIEKTSSDKDKEDIL